jgi:5'-nucleotidase
MEELQLNRRRFIKTAASFGAFGLLANSPLSVFARKQSTTITVLHTNDWHSRIEAFPMDGSNAQGLGGAAARVALIEKIRTESEHVLLLDAGDIFQGTPYFNFFGGELEYKLMSQMGYDAATLGNHDFDNGIEGIIKQLPHASFEFINCNYDVSQTPLAKHIKPYKILKKGNIKIGVLGIGIELAGLVPDANYKGIVYNDPVANANKVAAQLKNQHKCDLIICLSHLGYKYGGDKISDVKLAEQSEHIDLIIGGHTHTFLPQPDRIKNKIGKEVMVNQVGWAGIHLGRIDYTFEPFKNKDFQANTTIINIGSNKC